MASALVFRLPERGPELLREVLLERGWEDYEAGRRDREDWNLYWRTTRFCNSEYQNLMPWQRLNHHPKTAEITRKDCLARNLTRMRATFGASVYNFSPTTFILPNNYIRFLAEYNKLRVSKGLSAYWICKPVDLSRGRGIFIFEDIKSLVYDCTVIVQRYISNPLLISGYKFDLRIYVCVKSFNPLTVYVHQEGLVRFATEKYRLSSLRNLYAHLTNTSINKFGPFYKTEKESVGQGCKWTMSKFRHFLYGQDVNELLLWQRINNIVTLTLLTIAPSVPPSPNCVELFGFDILIDGRFKPWLLEVNYSPALTLDCQADIAVKKGLVSDLIDLMNYTWVDGLRERAYRRKGYKAPSSDAVKPSYVSVPALPTLKDPKIGEKKPHVPKLPSLKSQAEKGQRKLGPLAFVSGPLPPVDLNKMFSTSVVTATNTQSVDPIYSQHSRTKASTANRQMRPTLAPRLTDNRSRHVSEVTNHDDAETRAQREHLAEADISSSTPDIPPRGLGFKPSTVSWKLPHIHRTASKKTRGHIPPARVGDFIRTFPFNKATLKASQHTLDVRTVIQEVNKLTAHFSSGRRRPDKKKREEEEVKNAEEEEEEEEEDFDSLFWGPKDPPQIRLLLQNHQG
ncbi:putative tubulin polyglutamylase TTLL2 [Sphaeramia orbicularis]|uniref:putative tubulin polyglutamylase TTLL2 n=1 Tax=Sphaeramia orbicularis TaxID=375764 RepID=UPI0011811C31|nr:probable tubulin polyglutamylase TTLL2 [Sphaeramia orbicularis]